MSWTSERLMYVKFTPYVQGYTLECGQTILESYSYYLIYTVTVINIRLVNLLVPRLSCNVSIARKTGCQFSLKLLCSDLKKVMKVSNGVSSACIYMFKVNKGDTRTMCEITSFWCLYC